MSDDFDVTGVPDPAAGGYDEDDGGFDLPHKPKRDGPRKGHRFTWQEVWMRAVTQPQVDVYRAHLTDPGASLQRGVTWVFVASIAGSLMEAVASSMSRLGGPGMFAFDEALKANISLATALCCAPFSAVFGLLVFFIWNGIQYFIAVMLGGEGSFEDQIYSVASFVAPMSLIGVLVGMIPCFGPLAAFGALLYSLFLNVVALEAVHLFGRGKAVIASLWWLLLFCLCPIVLIIVLVVMGVAIGSAVQNIINEIITPTPSAIWLTPRLLFG
jgi:hypothetical protein